MLGSSSRSKGRGGKERRGEENERSEDGKGKENGEGEGWREGNEKRPFPERANDIDKFPIRVMGERRRLQKNEKGDVITNATHMESKKEYWENLMPINSTTKLKRTNP